MTEKYDEPTHKSASPKTEGLDSRIAAMELLSDVLDKKQPLDQLLSRQQSFLILDQRDRAFVRMLVSTSLRRLGQIDDLISRALSGPDVLKTRSIQHILRLGVAQMFFMDVPDHAAVDIAVRMADHLGFERQKGFVNGVLRTLGRVGQEWLKRQDAARLNTPEWLLKQWIADFGLREAAQIALANIAEAPLDLTIKSEDRLPYWGNVFKASQLSTGSLRIIGKGGSITGFEGFEEGEWWVQDAAAAIPARLFGNIEGREVIDLCAAPGGKTMQLASFGAHVTALDRSASRLKILEENAERMSLKDRITTQVGDAADWRPKDKNAPAPQRILLDAPCSATGTARRHPDVLHLKTPQDIERLAALQWRILNHALDILGSGGILIYCTCSLQKAEGEDQIERMLAARSDIQRVPIHDYEIGEYEELITKAGDLRILPYMLAAQGGIDGFFVSRLTKL